MNNNYVAFPRPSLGDALQRYTLANQYEEAIIIGIVGPEQNPEHWSATLMTRNGIEFFTSDKELRGRFDWVPIDWVFDSYHKCWIAPDAELVRPDVPAPEAGERYMTWKARVIRAVPELRQHDGLNEILSEAWRAKAKQAAS